MHYLSSHINSNSNSNFNSGSDSGSDLLFTESLVTGLYLYGDKHQTARAITLEKINIVHMETQ